MKYQYSLQIPSPCSENWDEMTAAKMGKFCAHCQETVIDFSEMTDNEIAIFLHAHANEKICGNITLSQSYKKYVFVEPQITTSPVKRYVMAMLAALMVASPTATNATHIPLYSVVQTNADGEKEKQSDNQENPKKNLVSGKLIDEATGKPLAYIKMRLEYQGTIGFLEEKRVYIEQQIAHLQAQKTPNKEEIAKKKTKIAEIKRQIEQLEAIISAHPDENFETTTDKNGNFSFELPSYVPKVQITLYLNLRESGEKNAEGKKTCYVGKRAEPIVMEYNQNTQNQVIKVKIKEEVKLVGRGITRSSSHKH